MFSIKKNLLYEDKYCFVINKPSGLMVHGDGKTKEKTLVDYLIKAYPELEGVGEPIRMEHAGKELSLDRPGIVHRLDKETSGVLLIARTQKAFLHFKQQFKDREIKKEYHTIVWGGFSEPIGTINAPIGRSKNDFRKWHSGRGKRGEEREAVTHYRVKKEIKNNEGTFSYLEVIPKTGRTHQIRVHMKYRNHPVVGDRLYADGKPYALGFTRLALHSRRLVFKDLEGIERTVEAPLPVDFEKALVL